MENLSAFRGTHDTQEGTQNEAQTRLSELLWLHHLLKVGTEKPPGGPGSVSRGLARTQTLVGAGSELRIFEGPGAKASGFFV